MRPKITKEELQEAYELWLKGVSFVNLGLIYKVHEETINRYIRRLELYGIDSLYQ